MIYLFVLLWAAVVSGRPNVIPLNVVTVPPNCPVGQQWINGQCRDIWNVHAEGQSDLDNSNVITVPTNCPTGQEWINGACRDVWRSGYKNVEFLPTENEDTSPSKNEDNYFRAQSDLDNSNVITVPTNCPTGQEWINGACRDVWRSGYKNVESLPTENEDTLPSKNEDNYFKAQSDLDNSNVITVPTNCPTGQEWINGACRDVWRSGYKNVESLPTENEDTLPSKNGDNYFKAQSDLDNSNVITVPTNCPTGQEWINGACRDVWRSGYKNVESLPTENEDTLPSKNEDNYFKAQSDLDNSNVITVPTNCPTGQEWINGACRDVWRSFYESVNSFGNLDTLPTENEESKPSRNVITVPTNCPTGQQLVNGVCRDIWNFNELKVVSLPLPTENEESTPNRNVITVPTNCPTGQQLVNGVCRDIWNFNELKVVSLPLPTENEESTPNRNVITVPTNCPTGQQLVNGVCRDIWNFNELNVVSLPLPTENEGSVPTENEDYLPVKNVITVPTNCPSGQEWINGACRDVWRSLLRRDNIVNFQDADIENIKNIITVPNQCPIGYRPDAHGICREIFP